MHNLRHLKYIVEAARLGSITEASKLLRVSQPAISAAIRGFEEEFKIRLFVRNPSRGLGLTPSGRNFVNRARELLENAKDFENLFNETDSDHLAGRLELACYAAPAPLLVPNLIQSFTKDYPDVEFGLHEGNMEQVAACLKDGTADLGLTYDIYPDSDIEHDVVTRLAPFVMMSANNPLAKKKKISLKDLANEPLIFMDSPGFREYFLYYFGMYDLKPRVLHRPTTNEMVRGMLAAGNGYSIGLVKIKNTRSYDGGTLVNIELEEVPPRVNLVVASLKGFRRGRLVEAFVDVCKKRLRRVATGTSLRTHETDQ
jgi:DNA-binding transcriptional LysR family regulator